MIVRGAVRLARRILWLARRSRFRGSDLKKFSAHMEMVTARSECATTAVIRERDASTLRAMWVGETVAEQQSLALAAARICQRRCSTLRGNRAAWRKVDSQRHENTHALQRRLARVRGRRYRTAQCMPRRRRAKIPRVCDETARVHRAQRSPVGMATGHSHQIMPTTPPAFDAAR